ncbi:isochorismatase [Brevibacillus sp. MCWH]|jgi:bifunctional isochorismate lyase / aryl carrier protein|uniref:isochorismatase n=1 Tax=Brevibacillus sp. MCWH TaxID=2508871 RepID=UPI001492B472|nr:isochorismatase [Brevibacillus sp. MCWH]NNV02338.1 isochorismatase [Brevibacillus sp. MCWH]
MAIPAILPYPMPVESDLPKNRVAWTPDPQRAALLIHDMQQYFLNAFTVTESPVVELLANIQKLKAYCAEQGIPVIYSAQPGKQSPEQRGLLQDFWGPGLTKCPDQQKIVDELAPGGQDLVLTKWRYSAFQQTNLLEMLQQRGRDQLIVCGIYAHIGCLMTACEAFMKDVQPFFVADAVADFSREKHMMALTYAAERCAVTITTQRLIDQLSGVQAEAPAARESDTQPITQEAIRAQVADLLQELPANLGENDDLINVWGLDSVRIMSLVERWRRSGAEVTFVELAEQPTLAAWWALLSSRLKQSLPNQDYFVV